MSAPFPIPPNCEYFKIHEGWGPVFIPPETLEDGREEILLSAWTKTAKDYALRPLGAWRPIIAAVAEVVWRREYDRVAAKALVCRMAKSKDVFDEHEEALKAAEAAMDNARLCRKWGEGE